MQTLYLVLSILSVLLWGIAIFMAYKGKNTKHVATVYVLGSIVYFIYIGWLWHESGRPPLRTMGEIRLWYTFFLSVTGLVLYARVRYNWLLIVSTFLSVMFICISLLKPELFDKTLPPALQSVWFVPHVTVYMFSYSILSIATVFAAYILKKSTGTALLAREQNVCHILVRIGWSLLTAGMVMGSLWAKEAWGDYWSWDPKETWAAATWMMYLVYIHNCTRVKNWKVLFLILLAAFLMLQMCWYGVNYLPSSKGSIHTYS